MKSRAERTSKSNYSILRVLQFYPRKPERLADRQDLAPELDCVALLAGSAHKRRPFEHREVDQRYFVRDQLIEGDGPMSVDTPEKCILQEREGASVLCWVERREGELTHD